MTTFKDLTSILLFKIGQNYVAENLCVYSITPEMMCKGSCVLEGVLKKNMDSEDSTRSSAHDEKPVQVLFVQDLCTPLVANSSSVQQAIGYIQPQYNWDYSKSLLQPPRFYS